MVRLTCTESAFLPRTPTQQQTDEQAFKLASPFRIRCVRKSCFPQPPACAPCGLKNFFTRELLASHREYYLFLAGLLSGVVTC